MPAPRKRGKRKSTGPRARAVPPAEREQEAIAERRCWLCSRPLGSEVAPSLLGQHVVEVHRECYEQAMNT